MTSRGADAAETIRGDLRGRRLMSKMQPMCRNGPYLGSTSVSLDEQQVARLQPQPGMNDVSLPGALGDSATGGALGGSARGVLRAAGSWRR